MQNKLISNHCNHEELILDKSRGEQICAICAEVLEENLVDHSKENYVDDYQNLRTGPKSSLMIHDGGLSTMIGKSNVDSGGKSLSNEMKNIMNRVRTWDSRSKAKTSAQKNLRLALLELDKLKEKMALSDAIVERAAYFYRKAMENDMTRGRSVKGIAGACLYAACRDMGTTRTIIEISKHIQEKRKVIAKSYRVLFQRLTLTVSVTDPTASIVRAANNLKINESTKREAFLILDTLRRQNVVAGKKPDSVAATVLYMACIKTKVNISQNKIATVFGITSITLRSRLKEFTKYVPLI